jgi:hypothetical protein
MSDTVGINKGTSITAATTSTKALIWSTAMAFAVMLLHGVLSVNDINKALCFVKGHAVLIVSSNTVITYTK